jgi:hypothetical protein
MTAVITHPPLSESTDSLLRFALRADATLTGLIGLAVAAAANPLSSLTGLTPAQEYGIGAAFVLYGLAVFSLAAVPNLRRIGTAMAIANAVGTVLVIAVVLADVVPLTEAGVLATLATGVYTAFFALLQYLGVRRLPA